jgi:hypothetical protein
MSYPAEDRHAVAWRRITAATGATSVAEALQVLRDLGSYESQIAATYNLSRWALRGACKRYAIAFIDGRKL